MSVDGNESAYMIVHYPMPLLDDNLVECPKMDVLAN